MDACRLRDQRLPGRVLETELGSRRMLAVIDHAGVARRRARLEKHQSEPCLGDPADKARVDAVAPCLAVDDAPERPLRQPRHPGGAASEASQHAGDVELAAADPDLQIPGLVEPLHPRRRQPQQGLAERHEVISGDCGGAACHVSAAAGRSPHPRGPPATVMTWPEMKDASSLHRNAIRLAMSRGTPARRTGICRTTSSFHSSGSRPSRIATARVISVSMKPGAMALTVTP